MKLSQLAKWSIFLASLMGYVWLSYVAKRSNFVQVIALFLSLFMLYWAIIKLNKTDFDYRHALFAAVVFRAVLLFALPNLSDDVYRFIWDGRLLAHGVNPFSHLPSYYASQSNTDISIFGLSRELFEKLNSPNYFAIYPPVCQYIFFIACRLSPNSILGSVVAMKLFILIFEMGNVLLIQRLLEKFNLNKNRALIYALNPLVIMELSGNLHFEAAMLFFLLLSLWLLSRLQNKTSALAFALSVCSKLVHPWYITTLVAISVLTPYRFAVVWSALIPLSYSNYISTITYLYPMRKNYGW